MSDRNLDDLEPIFSKKVKAWLQDCIAAGYTPLVTDGYRSFAEQDALYAQGRTTPGSKVTNAKGGDSPHNVRRAIDWTHLVNGQLDYSIDSLSKMAAIGKSYGMEWGGDWPASVGLSDTDHLQYYFCDACNERHPGAHYFNEDGSCKTTNSFQPKEV